MSYLMTFNSARSKQSDVHLNQQRLGNNQKITSSHHSTKGRFQNNHFHSDGGQLQLQRPLTKQILVSGSTEQQQSVGSRVTQAKTMNSCANTLISMDEVLEDLRVLEKQQLESQRQLESIRQAKAYKLEQKSTWSKKLSSVKFSNGESKEKVERARKVLSECSHILNDSRRKGDSFYGDLKHLDSRLKQVVRSLRCLQAKRRQADFDMMNVRQKQIRVARSKEDLEKRFHDVTAKRDCIINDEHHLSQLIQERYSMIKIIADESSDLIKLHSELELFLTAAQQKSISVKSKLDSLYLDAKDENQRHSETLSNGRDDLLCTQQLHDMLCKEIQAIREEINQISNECYEHWNRFCYLQPNCIGMTQSCHVVSDCLSTETAKREMLELRLREDENLLINFEKATGNFDVELLSAHENLIEIVQSTNNLNQGSESLKIQEMLRVEANKLLIVEIETRRMDLLRSKSSWSETEQKYQGAATGSHNKRNSISELISDQKQQLNESMTEIQCQTKILEELKQSHKDEQVQMAKRYDELSMDLTQKQKDLEELRVELSAVSASAALDSNSHDDVKSIMKTYEEELLELQMKMKERKKVHPCLESLQVSYDPGLSLEENVTASLRDLQSACDLKVTSVEKEMKKRLIHDSTSVFDKHGVPHSRRVRRKYTTNESPMKRDICHELEPSDSPVTGEVSKKPTREEENQRIRPTHPLKDFMNNGENQVREQVRSDKSCALLKDVSVKSPKPLSSKTIVSGDSSKSSQTVVDTVDLAKLESVSEIPSKISETFSCAADDAKTCKSKTVESHRILKKTISEKPPKEKSSIAYKNALASKRVETKEAEPRKIIKESVKPSKEIRSSHKQVRTTDIESHGVLKKMVGKSSRELSDLSDMAMASVSSDARSSKVNADIIAEGCTRDLNKYDSIVKHKTQQHKNSSKCLQSTKTGYYSNPGGVDRNALPKFDIFGSEDDAMCTFLNSNVGSLKKTNKEVIFNIVANTDTHSKVKAPLLLAQAPNSVQHSFAKATSLCKGSNIDKSARRRKKITSAGKGQDRNEFSADLGFM